MPGHSYKGSAAPPYKVAPLPPVVLVDDGGGDANWSWALPDPVWWSLQLFDGANWNEIVLAGGSQHTSSGDWNPGDIGSVIAEDADQNPISQRSNIITFS